MAIDTSGEWWTGTSPDDLEEYLRAYADDSYQVHEFRLARCECGSLEFLLDSSDPDGVARRTCLKCQNEHFICDSGEFWNDAETERWACIDCESSTANIGVGFSLYEDRADIKWIYIGVRCAHCGVLGCCAGWKVGYGPSLQLMNQV